MNPVLLMPAALAALAALALPLLIHLARRQQQRPTVFAALRWLRPRPRPRRRLRFDEPWLLALRLLLLALLVLFLARPALLGVAGLQPRLLVVPGLDAAALAQAGADAEVEARWLAPGFPALEQPRPEGRVAVASLLREYDASLSPGAPLTVLVPQRLLGADGARLQLTREVTWRIVPGGAWTESATVPPPSVAIRYDAAHREGVAYLWALAQAWGEDDVEVDVAEGTDPPSAEVDLLAWLSDGPLPDEVVRRVEQGDQILLPASASWPGAAQPAVLWRDEAGAPLLHAAALGQGRLLQLARPLAPATMPQLLDPAFPQTLRDFVQPPPAPTAVAAADYTPRTGAQALAPEPQDLRPWFALAIALLFLLERWLASARRRGAAA